MNPDHPTLLIVEDDDLQYEIYEEALAAYRLVRVKKGSDALKQIPQDPPDALILDHILDAGERGLDFLPAFKELLPFVPIIIVSGALHLSLPHAVVFVVPITSRDRGLRHQIPIASQASGLSKLPSFARPEDARAVAYQRLERRIGAVAPAELAAVRRILRVFLDL